MLGHCGILGRPDEVFMAVQERAKPVCCIFRVLADILEEPGGVLCIIEYCSDPIFDPVVDCATQASEILRIVSWKQVSSNEN